MQWVLVAEVAPAHPLSLAHPARQSGKLRRERIVVSGLGPQGQGLGTECQALVQVALQWDWLGSDS